MFTMIPPYTSERAVIRFPGFGKCKIRGWRQAIIFNGIVCIKAALWKASRTEGMVIADWWIGTKVVK